MKHKNVTLEDIIHRDDDADKFIDLDRLLRIAVRRSTLIGAAIVTGIAIGGLYLLTATPMYTSMTKILLDETLARYGEENPSPANSQLLDVQISSAVEILKSGKIALRVVDDINLADSETILNPPQSITGTVKGWIRTAANLFSSGPGLSEKAARDGRRQKAAALVQQGVAVERVARSSVVALSYASTDPVLAAAVVRTYAQAYLSDQLNANYTASESASVWLQQQLTDLAQRSQAAALDVERFRAENGLTAARGELMSEQQLADLNSQLILAQADAATASARYNQYKSIVDQGEQNAIENAMISAKEGDNSDIRDLRTRYLDISKREQDVTRSFSSDHPQAVSLRAEKEDIGAQIYGELQQLTASYRNEYEVARAREDSLRASIAGITGRNSDSSQSLVQLRDLEQKASALKMLYDSYLTRYEQASQQRSFPIAKARIISEAGIPASPSSPRRTMVLAMSAVLGLLAGAAVAAFLEFRERSFRLESDVRDILGHRSLGYLPFLGSVAKQPAAHFGKNLAHVRPSASPARQSLPFERLIRVVLDAPRSRFSEVLRNARLTADQRLAGHASRVVGIVSAVPGEGKSVVAANFAAIIAAGGKRALLIDADIRKPGVSKAVSATPVTGLVDVLSGLAAWTSAVKVDQASGLAILPVGEQAADGAPVDSAELLSSTAMARLIEEVRKTFDYVVVDLPAMAPVIDARAFSPLADGFLFVVKWGETPARLAQTVLQSEPKIDSKVFGVILSQTDMDALTRYSTVDGPETYQKAFRKYYTDDANIGA